MADEGRKVRFEEMFPWEISAAMAEAPLCYLPLGTLEWHGEHAAVGLDALLPSRRNDPADAVPHAALQQPQGAHHVHFRVEVRFAHRAPDIHLSGLVA